MNLKDTFDEHLLDLAQTEANFDIEKDEGKNYHQPMKFDRMGICKHCESLKIKYGSTDTKYWCAKTMNYWANKIRFCEESNELVEKLEAKWLLENQSVI